ncbi:MAG: hypothetical protein M3O82_04100 [Verrucomicrobiota bacterium]|nr:hypothetical protein [Verrucomicrobiota bacterium]
MSDSQVPLDFQILPDWVKEPAVRPRYEDYDEQPDERPRRRSDNRRPEQARHREKSGARPPRQRDRPPPDRRSEPMHERPAVAPVVAPFITVEFLPEPESAKRIAREIKGTGHSYPLFQLARMFLDRPERHRVKIASADPARLLHECAGIVALDQQMVENAAFAIAKNDFYDEEQTEKEAPPGNFANVARCRLSGTLIAPTNHHSFQPLLRRLFEERFRRRMSFDEYRQQIDVCTDPQTIDEWREQSRKSTIYRTRGEGDAIVFDTAAATEAHFRATHLPALLRTASAVEISGEKSRETPDRMLASAVRQEWQKQHAFPAQMMNHLRQFFAAEHLHIFRHRKRMLFVSAIRPRPFREAASALSENVGTILGLLQAGVSCTRVDLAQKYLAGRDGDPVRLKSALASDLHWLIGSGHVIEFHDGKLELPLENKPDAGPPKVGTEAEPTVPQPTADAQ